MAEVERKLLFVNSPLMREIVAEVDLKLFEIKSLRTVVDEALIVRPELLTVVRVDEVERKLLAVVSPEKETVPLMVASVDEAMLAPPLRKVI